MEEDSDLRELALNETIGSRLLVVEGPTVPFNPRDPKYKCCCNTCHVTTGAKIVEIVTGIELLVELIACIVGHSLAGEMLTGAFWTALTYILGFAVLHLCLFWGLHTERPSFLIPYMVMQIISLVFFGIVSLIFIVDLGRGGAAMLEVMEENEGGGGDRVTAMGLDLLILSLLLLFAAIRIWFFFLIKDCYHYFKDKEFYRNAASRQGPNYYKNVGVARGELA